MRLPDQVLQMDINSETFVQFFLLPLPVIKKMRGGVYDRIEPLHVNTGNL